MTKNLFLYSSLLGALFFAPNLVSAQSSDIDQRLHRLENELQTLNRAVYKGEMPAPTPDFSGSGDTAAQAVMQQRLQELEVQIRNMNGQLEEQAHETRMLQRQIDQNKRNYEEQIKTLQNQLAEQKKQAAPVKIAPEQTKNVLPDTQNTETPVAKPDSALSASGATAQYESAFALLKQGSYDQAQSKFEDFIQKYPDHMLNANARYWLGESHYVREQYDKAARLFAEGFQKAPEGPKAADNLLKLGLSLSALQKKEDACVALRQVEKDFSNGNSAVLKRAKKEIGNLGCS